MGKVPKSEYRFKKHESIGTEGAEEDQAFLYDCFVNTGDIDTLCDMSSAKRIVLGRTGVGKTALMMMLSEKEDNVINIDPEQLSFKHISNSTIIPKLVDIGVDLMIFYKLLWKHLLVIELIKYKYSITTEEKQNTFFSWITDNFKSDKRKKEALEYLFCWGKKFWEDTEYRTHEVTNKLEEDVKASLGTNLKFIENGMFIGEKVTNEEKIELKHRVQAVVNNVQIEKLSRVIDFLEKDIFTDKQQNYFIIIDKLDEHWIDEGIKYHLIRALIEVIREFKKISSVKIVASLRVDLLNRVYKKTRDNGFQEEKYQPLMLKLQWSEKELLEIVDQRISTLVKRRYIKRRVSFKDIFPDKVNKQETIDYLLDRTLNRPRDIINFANCCLEIADGRSDISAAIVREAESTYSSLRFKALGDEWHADYPKLLDFASIIKNTKKTFYLNEIPNPKVEETIIEVLSQGEGYPEGTLGRAAELVMDGKTSTNDFKLAAMKVFYKVGLIGVKIKNESVNWSFMDRNLLREAEILKSHRFIVRPMVYRVLGTKLEV